MIKITSQISRIPVKPGARKSPSPAMAKVGTRWHKQRLRRSHILSVFLEMLNTLEPDDISLGDIASASGVAVQTIYNLVGNRSQLISAAIEEWGNAVFAFARQEAELQAHNPLIMSLQMHWSAVIAQHGFVLRTARLAYGCENWQHWACDFATRSFLEDLNRIEDAGDIAPGVHVPALARQISYAANGSVSGWIAGRYGLDEFRNDLVHGPGLMLAGALKGRSLEKLRFSLDCWSHGGPETLLIPGMPIHGSA